MTLYIDELPDEAKITINGFLDENSNNPDNTVAVEGFISSEVTFSGSTSYSSGFLTSGMQESLGKLGNQIGAGLNLLLDQEVQSFQLKTVKDTLMMWQGSENFPINIPLMFVAIDPESNSTAMGADVRKPVRTIMKALYPEFQEDSPLTGVFKAPNQYKAGQVRNVSGALSLKIGSWFRSLGKKFLLQSANFTFSKETLRSGLPIYASGNIELISFRVLSGREVARMLRV